MCSLLSCFNSYQYLLFSQLVHTHTVMDKLCSSAQALRYDSLTQEWTLHTLSHCLSLVIFLWLARPPPQAHWLSFFCFSSRQIDAHEDDVNAVAFADSSSQLLFSGSDDALCKVWDRRTLREDRPQPVGQLAGHRDGITFIHSKVGGWGEECCLYFINLPLESSFNPPG